MPCSAEVGHEGGEGSVDEAASEVGDCGADKVIAAADGEGHTMASVRGGVGVEDTVGGAVVTGGVHGVGACAVEGSLFGRVSH